MTTDYITLNVHLRSNPPEMIEKMYNSKELQAFNAHSFTEIKNRLGGNMDPAWFDYVDEYDPELGLLTEYAINRKERDVRVGNRHFKLAPGKYKFGISRKYNQINIKRELEAAGYEMVDWVQSHYNPDTGDQAFGMATARKLSVAEIRDRKRLEQAQRKQTQRKQAIIQ